MIISNETFELNRKIKKIWRALQMRWIECYMKLPENI